MPDLRRSDLAQLLAAVRAGRLTPHSALQWAHRAAAGEPIAIVTQFAAAATPPAEADVTRLASDLAVILAGGPGEFASMWPVDRSREPLYRDSIFELTDAEADQLFPPPAASDPAAVRERQVASAAAHAATLTDDQLLAVLFPPPGAFGPPGR